METGHPGDVSGSVQEVLLRSLAVEPDRHEIAFVLLHHQLEVCVRQEVFVLETRVVEHSCNAQQGGTLNNGGNVHKKRKKRGTLRGSCWNFG